MYYTIQEVMAGLKEKKAYIRHFGGEQVLRQGHEVVQPIGEGRFEHIYAGPDYGATNELPIEDLGNGRWPEDFWELMED